MTINEKKFPSLSVIHHIGILVWDSEKTIKYYESLGIGPFKASVRNYKERLFRGKPAGLDPDVEELAARVGNMFIILMSPVKGKTSFYTKLLETRGENVHHVAFQVDDIDKEQTDLAKRGLNVIYSARYHGGGGAVYFETEKDAGTILELYQPPPDQLYLWLK
jgi:methylmalonyl-CoA/ethylmalonyl-CoA epimerase